MSRNLEKLTRYQLTMLSKIQTYLLFTITTLMGPCFQDRSPDFPIKMLHFQMPYQNPQQLNLSQDIFIKPFHLTIISVFEVLDLPVLQRSISKNISSNIVHLRILQMLRQFQSIPIFKQMATISIQIKTYKIRFQILSCLINKILLLHHGSLHFTKTKNFRYLRSHCRSVQISQNTTKLINISHLSSKRHSKNLSSKSVSNKVPENSQTNSKFLQICLHFQIGSRFSKTTLPKNSVQNILNMNPFSRISKCYNFLVTTFIKNKLNDRASLTKNQPLWFLSRQ